MSTPAELATALADLAECLASEGISWYVFGAQAVIAYGDPRLTADLDITADLRPENVEPFVAALAQAGFSLRVEPIADFVTRTRVIPVVHHPTGLPDPQST